MYAKVMYVYMGYVTVTAWEAVLSGEYQVVVTTETEDGLELWLAAVNAAAAACEVAAGVNPSWVEMEAVSLTEAEGVERWVSGRVAASACLPLYRVEAWASE